VERKIKKAHQKDFTKPQNRFCKRKEAQDPRNLRRQERKKGFMCTRREDTKVVKHLLIAAILVRKKSENLHCSPANQIISQTSFRNLLRLCCSDEKSKCLYFRRFEKPCLHNLPTLKGLEGLQINPQKKRGTGEQKIRQRKARKWVTEKQTIRAHAHHTSPFLSVRAWRPGIEPQLPRNWGGWANHLSARPSRTAPRERSSGIVGAVIYWAFGLKEVSVIMKASGGRRIGGKIPRKNRPHKTHGFTWGF